MKLWQPSESADLLEKVVEKDADGSTTSSGIQVLLRFSNPADLSTVWTRLAQKYATGSGAVILMGRTVLRQINDSEVEVTSSGDNPEADIDACINGALAPIVEEFAPEASVEFATRVLG